MRRLLEILIQQVPLDAKYADHPLRGPWRGHREVHIQPDWLLIYRVTRDELHLARTGSHADLFKQ